MFRRIIESTIIKQLDQREMIIINGPRRVGKTTLLKSIEKKVNWRTSYFDFTDPAVQRTWQNFSQARIKAILEDIGMSSKKGLLFFDEIQYFDDIGILLKLIYDHFPNIKVVATGSSSFLLLQTIGDSLAGRKKIFILYPLSIDEITNISPRDYWRFEEKPATASHLQEIVGRMVLFGSYPEILTSESSSARIEKLREIVDSYLFKDLLMTEGLKKPRVIVELTKLLAYQIGSFVNPNEIAATLGISRETVLNYIDLLEKFFIVFKVYPYEKNLRDVVKKKFKVYFFDTGIRNAVIGNFRPLKERDDKGFLLENAVAVGLKRRIAYENRLLELYFWRNYDGKEVDIVLKNDKTLGFEVKWEKMRKKLPRSFFAKGEVVDFLGSYRFLF